MNETISLVKNNLLAIKLSRKFSASVEVDVLEGYTIVGAAVTPCSTIILIVAMLFARLASAPTLVNAPSAKSLALFNPANVCAFWLVSTTLAVPLV